MAAANGSAKQRTRMGGTFMPRSKHITLRKAILPWLRSRADLVARVVAKENAAGRLSTCRVQRQSLHLWPHVFALSCSSDLSRHRWSWLSGVSSHRPALVGGPPRHWDRQFHHRLDREYRASRWE